MVNKILNVAQPKILVGSEYNTTLCKFLVMNIDILHYILTKLLTLIVFWAGP